MLPISDLVVHVLREPVTATEFAERAGIQVGTARKQIARWLERGMVHEAGRVCQARGAPAMRYCLDAEVARAAREQVAPPPTAPLLERVRAALAERS